MGGTANFSCSAEGHPASTLTWQFNVSFCSFRFYVIYWVDEGEVTDIGISCISMCLKAAHYPISLNLLFFAIK